MDTTQLLTGALFAMLLGLFGQGLRAAAGLKKQADEATLEGKKLGDALDKTALVFSLFIGALAGLAAFLGLQYGGGEGVDFSKGSTMLGMVSAGYAGADFIESFGRKYLPR